MWWYETFWLPYWFPKYIISISFRSVWATFFLLSLSFSNNKSLLAIHIQYCHPRSLENFLFVISLIGSKEDKFVSIQFSSFIWNYRPSHLICSILKIIHHLFHLFLLFAKMFQSSSSDSVKSSMVSHGQNSWLSPYTILFRSIIL